MIFIKHFSNEMNVDGPLRLSFHHGKAQEKQKEKEEESSSDEELQQPPQMARFPSFEGNQEDKEEASLGQERVKRRKLEEAEEDRLRKELYSLLSQNPSLNTEYQKGALALIADLDKDELLKLKLHLTTQMNSCIDLDFSTSVLDFMARFFPWTDPEITRNHLAKNVALQASFRTAFASKLYFLHPILKTVLLIGIEWLKSVNDTREVATKNCCSRNPGRIYSYTEPTSSPSLSSGDDEPADETTDAKVECEVDKEGLWEEINI